MLSLLKIFLVLSLLLFFPRFSLAELKIAYSEFREGRLVFAYTPPGEKSEIYVLDYKKATIAPLLSNAGNNECPAWSPDGTKVIFHSDITGNRQIYVMDSDGSNLKRLTKNSAFDENPSWSPDGKKFIFNRRGKTEEERSNLFVMNEDGSKETLILSDNSSNAVPQWSPRGDEILYTTPRFPGWDIGLFNMKTKKVQILTEGRRSYFRPAWSPDGSAFIFSYGEGNDIDLWLEKKGAPQAVQLTSFVGREYDATWSEDGGKVFFVSEEQAGAGNFQLFFIELSSGKSAQLTSGVGSIRHPSWTSLPSLPPREEKGLQKAEMQAKKSSESTHVEKKLPNPDEPEKF